MDLVIEHREHVMAPAPEAQVRSTEIALRNMGWPFPVEGRPAPRRPMPQLRSGVVELRRPVIERPERPAYEPVPLAFAAAC